MSQLILFILQNLANTGEVVCRFIDKPTSFVFFGEPNFSEIPPNIIRRD